MKQISEVLTLPLFTAFVKAQPQEEVFNYADPRGCAIAQYLTSLGYEDVKVDGYAVYSPWPRTDIPLDIIYPMDAMLCLPSMSFTWATLAHYLDKECKPKVTQ